VGELMARARDGRVPLRDVGRVGGREIRLGGARVPLDVVATAHAEGLPSLLD
jgi:hypothetical protein